MPIVKFVKEKKEIEVPEGAMTLPAQDWESALFQGELVGRDIDPGSGPELEGPSVALAEALIELRLQHDDAAVAQLRQAAWGTAAAHRAGLAATRPGLREASVRAAMEAAEAGADYVAFGAFFPTTTKAVEHMAELETLSIWQESMETPCVAIGGITADNARQVAEAGADFIAVSGAVWNHPDGPAAGVKALLPAIA